MYKTAIRALLRRNVERLNAGDATTLLKQGSPDVVIAFPGDNSWSTMFGPAPTGRDRYVTHRGIAECTAFAEKFTSNGVQFEIEDILVNGPPWNTRIALRVKSFVPPEQPGQADEYNNRAVAILELKWGRIVAWEDYEDTERVAAWDRRQAAAAPVAT